MRSILESPACQPRLHAAFPAGSRDARPLSDIVQEMACLSAMAQHGCVPYILALFAGIAPAASGFLPDGFARLSPGKRFSWPTPVGSADAPPLARLAAREKSAGRITAIVTADASDAQRLIRRNGVFLRPSCARPCSPTGKPCPTTPFSPHQDLISERLATLWRFASATTPTAPMWCWCLPPRPCTGWRRPSFLAGYTFEFKQGQKLDEAKPQGPADAGGLPARLPGGQPRRIRCARRAD